MVKIQVLVRLKGTILDPQGTTLKNALTHLGFSTLKDVRMGKLVELSIDTNDVEEAKKAADQMAKDLLANMIIEDYEVKLA